MCKDNSFFEEKLSVFKVEWPLESDQSSSCGLTRTGILVIIIRVSTKGTAFFQPLKGVAQSALSHCPRDSCLDGKFSSVLQFKKLIDRFRKNISCFLYL